VEVWVWLGLAFTKHELSVLEKMVWFYKLYKFVFKLARLGN